MKHAFCFLLLLFAGTSVSASVLIDDFSDGAIELVRSEGTVVTTQNNLDPHRVLGGVRHFQLGQYGALHQFATIDTESETLELGSLSSGLAYLNLQYGSRDSPLSVDLTANGSDRILIDFQGPRAPGWLRITSGNGQESIRSLFFLNEQSHLLFSDFEPTIDFTDVSWIALDTFRSTGYILKTIQAVPEPHSCMLLWPLVAYVFQLARTSKRSLPQNNRMHVRTGKVLMTSGWESRLGNR